jgi:predicted nucleic acid-binding protein
VILVDSNVPMYLVGAAHPHKVDAQNLIERCLTDGKQLVTDVEVFQEILHRYVAINRREAIGPAFDVLLRIVDQVFPIDLDVMRSTRDVVMGRPGLSARDAVHIAVMERHQIDTILSFDRGFDDCPGIKRLG